MSRMRVQSEGNATDLQVSQEVVDKNAYIHVVLDACVLHKFLDNFGRNAWNHWIERIQCQNAFAPFASPDGEETVEPVVVDLDFRGTHFVGMDLHDLNLRFARMDNSDFTGADLTSARMGFV